MYAKFDTLCISLDWTDSNLSRQIVRLTSSYFSLNFGRKNIRLKPQLRFSLLEEHYYLPVWLSLMNGSLGQISDWLRKPTVRVIAILRQSHCPLSFHHIPWKSLFFIRASNISNTFHELSLFTCVSVSMRLVATSNRFGRDKYLFCLKWFSSSRSCCDVKAVRGRLVLPGGSSPWPGRKRREVDYYREDVSN